MIEVRPFLLGIEDGEYLEDYRDVPCKNPAKGTHERTVRVCASCGHQLMSEGFFIVWDEETK